MLEHKVSPLLDAMEVEECFARHDGTSCYRILHPESGREFVLKHISVPATPEQVEALLLTGAYSSEEEIDAYYRKEAEGLVQEAEARKKLLDCPYILPFLGAQMEKKEGVGYDVYAVLPKRNSLETYLNENAVSHLRGINMGIDLCEALTALREEGYVHANLKPGNVFFSDTGRFLLGDFGLISTEDMQYAVLPEQYRSSYSAPELSGFIGGLNPTVDIYSLGMILYRIYNGNHAPFEDEKTSAKAADARRVEGEALPAPLYADYELTEIILKACAHDPAARYQTPGEMRLDLENYMRRNAVSDHLIVPPLVNSEGPLTAEAAGEEPEPVRFADPEKLDEDFKKAFKPEESRKDRKRKKAEKQEPPAPAEPEPAPEPALPPELPPEPAEENRPEPEQPKPAEAPEKKETPEQPEPEKPEKDKKDKEKQERKKKRRKRGWLIFAVVMLLLAAAIAAYEFTDLGKGRWHYFVNVDKLEVGDLTDSSLKLNLTTNGNPEEFTALCQDAYGNSRTGSFENGVAVFEDLTPNTQYTLKVELPGTHQLTGATSVTAVTRARTEILTFEAGEGAEEGSVRLDLVVKDESTEPAFWTLEYGKAGSEPRQTQFSGHNVQINGLESGETYTFTLVETENLYLSGATETSFTLRSPVRAEGLSVVSVAEGNALLSWRCTSELPEQWELTCTGPDGKELPVQMLGPAQEEGGWTCSAAVSGLALDTPYQVRLSAPGLAEPLTLELKEEGIALTSFTAEVTENGLNLRWEAAREPEAGWRVTAAYGDNMRFEETVHGDSCQMAVLPDTDYALTLEAADGTPLKGVNTASARSLPSQRFTQMGLDDNTTIGTYFTPDKTEWTFEDLDSGTIRYRRSDKITFVITAAGTPADSDETVTVQYVVREAVSGRVVNVEQEKLIWNTLWEGNRWFGQIPWLPEAPGEYTFTIYVNSQRLGTMGFTLIE